jgi:hypothetical protein
MGMCHGKLILFWGTVDLDDSVPVVTDRPVGSSGFGAAEEIFRRWSLLAHLKSKIWI